MRAREEKLPCLWKKDYTWLRQSLYTSIQLETCKATLWLNALPDYFISHYENQIALLTLENSSVGIKFEITMPWGMPHSSGCFIKLNPARNLVWCFIWLLNIGCLILDLQRECLLVFKDRFVSGLPYRPKYHKNNLHRFLSNILDTKQQSFPKESSIIIHGIHP